LLYSALGLVGTGFSGAGLHGVAYLWAVYSPLLVFPLFLISFISLRWSVFLLWAYIIADQIYVARGNWRTLLSSATLTRSSQADRWLLLAVILMSVALVVEYRRRGNLTRT
jgi:hypothetical protein